MLALEAKDATMKLSDQKSETVTNCLNREIVNEICRRR
jgi:hypothetical protein